MQWSIYWMFGYFLAGIMFKFITHLVAKPKGLSRTWTSLAAILGLIVVVIVVALPAANPSQRYDGEGESEPWGELLVNWLLDLVFVGIGCGPFLFLILSA